MLIQAGQSFCLSSLPNSWAQSFSREPYARRKRRSQDQRSVHFSDSSASLDTSVCSLSFVGTEPCVLGAAGAEIILTFQRLPGHPSSLSVVTFFLSSPLPSLTLPLLIPGTREQSCPARPIGLAGNDCCFQVRKANFIQIKKWGVGRKGRKGSVSKLRG